MAEEKKNGSGKTYRTIEKLSQHYPPTKPLQMAALAGKKKGDSK